MRGSPAVEFVTAIKVTDRERGEHAFLTWGRVHDATDPANLLTALKRLLPTMGFCNVERVAVCYDLGDVQHYRYFFEALLNFAARMATEPYDTDDWVKAQRSDES